MPNKKTKTLIDFNGDWIDKIPPLNVSTAGLQVAKTDPWDEILQGSDIPTDLLLEEAKVNTTLLPFQVCQCNLKLNNFLWFNI